MVCGHAKPGCSHFALAETEGEVVWGHARPGCSRSALAGTGGKVVKA